MTYWRMTKGVRLHPCIKPEETVFHACYGLSQQFVEMAKKTSGKAHLNLINPQAWRPDKAKSEQLATPLSRTGVLAITDHRMLFFQKRFSIGRVKKLAAEWTLQQVTGLSYDNNESNMLIEFVDGSSAGLHIPWIQGPEKLVKAYVEQKNQDT